MTQQSRDDNAVASWREQYPVHPCADVFPMLPDDQQGALAQDIRENGLRERIVLWGDTSTKETPITYAVLDGRNRLEALARNGVPIPSDPTTEPKMFRIVVSHMWADGRPVKSHVDPALFVISANVRRRHLTKAQQAELIVRALEAGRNDRANTARSFSPTPGKRGGSTKDPLLAEAVAVAKKQGIEKRTVQAAKAKVEGKPKHACGSGSLHVPPTPTATTLEVVLSESAAKVAKTTQVVNDGPLVVVPMPRKPPSVHQVVEKVSLVVEALKGQGYTPRHICDGLRSVAKLVERQSQLVSPKPTQAELPPTGLVAEPPPTS